MTIYTITRHSSQNTMSQLIQFFFSLPPIKPLDTTKPFPPTFQPNTYFHYHRQKEHDTKQ